MGLNQRDLTSRADLNLTAAIQIDDREAREFIMTEGNLPVGDESAPDSVEVTVEVSRDELEEAVEDREEPESDADVTHTEEDDDPESMIGDEVDYDLGTDEEA